jgi:hypothetical protein
MTYHIRVIGQLDPTWDGWFDGLVITPEAAGTTLLTGNLDQAALHAVLRKIRDLGLILLLVMRMDKFTGVTHGNNASRSD